MDICAGAPMVELRQQYRAAGRTRASRSGIEYGEEFKVIMWQLELVGVPGTTSSVRPTSGAWTSIRDIHTYHISRT